MLELIQGYVPNDMWS